jgi:hypothetical protein
MSRILSLLFVVILLALAGAVVFLGTWNLPAPTTRVEKLIPDDRLPH